MTHIHLVDHIDDNIRMVLVPTSDGAAPVIYTYTVSGLNNAQGMTFDGTHIHLGDRIDRNVRMILPPTSDGAAPVVYTYTVSGLTDPWGITFDGTHIHLSDRIDNNVRMILPPTANGAASVVYTYTVSGTAEPRGMAFDGTHIHFVDDANNNVSMFLPPTADGEVSAVYTYTVDGLSAPQGATFDGTHIHLVDEVDDNVRMILPPTSDGEVSAVYTYTVAGLNTPGGMAFDGGLTSDATLTITTADTDRRVGEATDYNIASDIDISDFEASDITVTGGTVNSLSETDAQNWVANITPTVVGTMTIAIAEDAVSPGNAAVSQPFTINARVSASIAFDETALETDGTTQVTVTWSESVSGFIASELTASAGTLSNFSHSGNTTTATLTAPSSGSGTITVTVAADAVTAGGLGNLAATADISYTQAVEPLSLSWANIPTQDVGLMFQVELHSNHEISGLGVGDIRLRRSDGTFFNPSAANLSIVRITGTNNYTFTFDYTGVLTGSNEYRIRLVPNSVQYDGSNHPSSSLNSTEFTIDASIGADLMPSFGSSTISDITATQNSAIMTVTLPAASGGDTPLSYSISPTLPAGLSFNATTRELSGTPTGTLTQTEFTYTVTDDDGDTDTIQFDITVNAAPPPDLMPSFGSETIADISATQNTAITTVTLPAATGGDTPLTYSLSPSLPSGLSFNATTRELSGTPTETLTETEFTYTVTDDDGDTDTIQFDITVNAAPAVATTLLIVSGNNQTALISTALLNPLVVQVNDQNGDALSGVTVGFSTTGGTLSNSSVVTGANGRASVTLTLPATAGSYTVTASVTGLTDVTFTATATAVSAVTIQQLGIQNIPVNTEDYELPISVTGSPDSVRGIGDWEEFYGDWDAGAGTFYIRADNVTILKAGATWRIEAVKGTETVTRTIQHNVINSLPVIVDPDRLYFFKEIENHKFIEVSNIPASASVRGDLIGMNAGIESIESGAQGIGIRGTPKETVNLSDDLSVDLYVENPAGNASLTKAFDLLDAPTLFVLTRDTTTGQTVWKIARTHKDTPNDTVAAVYPFSLAEPPSSGTIRDIKRVGEFIYALYAGTGNDDNLILKYAKGTVENLLGEIIETLTLPSGISEPTAFLPRGNDEFNVVDRSTRRIHWIRPSSDDATVLELWINSLAPSTFTDIRGLYIDAAGDAYVLNGSDIGVVNGGNLAAVNLAFNREFNIPSGITRARSLYVDGTYCYICNNFAGTEDQKIVRFNKNTADGQTASINRAFDLPPNLTFPEGIFIDE